MYDIKNIERLPKVDLWAYSFPCTYIFLAAKRKVLLKAAIPIHHFYGKCKELLEVMEENIELPKYLLMENVVFLVII